MTEQGTGKGLGERLSEIQGKLVAPKSQFNAFGKYKYRKCEDILEAVKPLLNGLGLTITDEVVQVGDRYYVKATAKIFNGVGNGAISVTALAREEESKKGMDGAQITGAASSYARKYALNGLFLIDDSADSDRTNTGDQTIELISDKERGTLLDMINEYKVDEARFLVYMKIEKLEAMPKSKYLQAVSALKTKVKVKQ